METISLFEVTCHGGGRRLYSSLQGMYTGCVHDGSVFCQAGPCCDKDRRVCQRHYIAELFEIDSLDERFDYTAQYCEHCNELYVVPDGEERPPECWIYMPDCKQACDHSLWPGVLHRCYDEHRRSTKLLGVRLLAEVPYLSEHIGEPPWRYDDAYFPQHFAC